MLIYMIYALILHVCNIQLNSPPMWVFTYGQMQKSELTQYHQDHEGRSPVVKKRVKSSWEFCQVKKFNQLNQMKKSTWTNSPWTYKWNLKKALKKKKKKQLNICYSFDHISQPQMEQSDRKVIIRVYARKYFFSPQRSPSLSQTRSQPRRAAAQTCCCHTYTGRVLSENIQKNVIFQITQLGHNVEGYTEMFSFHLLSRLRID